MPYVVFFEQNLIIGKLLIAVAILIIAQFTVSFAPILLLAGVFSLLFANLK
jgi:hypothetical protein